MSDQELNNNAPLETEDVVATDEEGNPLTSKAGKSKSSAGNITDDEEIVSENGGAGEDSIKRLREKLATCIEEKQKYMDGWQRDKAEFLNARKRDKEANAELLKYAKEDVISELIPVLDSFDMAFGNKEAWEKVDKNWRAGVEYIHSQFISILGNHSLAIIDPINQKFDPARDEAIEYEKVTDASKDQVITKVIQKGYSLNGKIIKAPKVKVGELQK